MKDSASVDLRKLPSTAPRALPKDEARRETERIRQDLVELQNRLYAENRRSVLIILQGMDASGKDGLIRKVFSGLNPQGVRVHSFKEPTTEELAHDFLWRIHAQVPAKGMIGVFNRSHYEDVLVTRVYDMIDSRAAKARLKQIRHFEELLSASGTRVLKFYLHISKDEQKERLQARLDEPGKHWKFNPGDLKDREHWNEFTSAYQDALSTSTVDAPWYVIPADHKWFRDLLISQIILDTLRDMKPKYPATTFDPAEIRIV